uniref:Uncharacterized protein n=1 Tax=Rhizophora mucronata TaxID=61149 RepID=A0A2P2MYI5_RHIMU
MKIFCSSAILIVPKLMVLVEYNSLVIIYLCSSQLSRISYHLSHV